MPLSISLKVGDPVPVALGDCADALGLVRYKRLKLDKDAAELKKRETEIENHLIAAMAQQHPNDGRRPLPRRGAHPDAHSQHKRLAGAVCVGCRDRADRGAV